MHKSFFTGLRPASLRDASRTLTRKGSAQKSGFPHEQLPRKEERKQNYFCNKPAKYSFCFIVNGSVFSSLEYCKR
jgi:hypothetical protein